MNNWKNKQVFCTGCGRWLSAHHISIHDPRNLPDKCLAGGGQKLVNIATGQDYCTACKQYDQVENTVFYCNCGHVQRAIYEDTGVLVQAEAGVLARADQAVYRATATDTYLIGQRRFLNVRGM